MHNGAQSPTEVVQIYALRAVGDCNDENWNLVINGLTPELFEMQLKLKKTLIDDSSSIVRSSQDAHGIVHEKYAWPRAATYLLKDEIE